MWSAAFSLVQHAEFIDWRFFWFTFSHVGIFDPALWSVFSPVAPLPFSLVTTSPHPSLCQRTVHTDSEWLGGVGDVESCWRPYFAGVLHPVSDQIQNLQNCSTIPRDPLGYIGWRNRFIGIDSWAPWMFTNSGSVGMSTVCTESVLLWMFWNGMIGVGLNRKESYKCPWLFLFWVVFLDPRKFFFVSRLFYNFAVDKNLHVCSRTLKYLLLK